MEQKIEILKKIIDTSSNIVFFGGAGVSTESGIPDFRSQDGLYNHKYDYPPEEILSHHFFILHTKEFFRFYKEKMNVLKFSPNITHNTLSKLEQVGKLKAIITQNIDGLHQKSGSKNVFELHGSVYRNYCMKCNKFYDANAIFTNETIPKCSCGGIIKPDVVLYDEPLDNLIVSKSIDSIIDADTLIIGGTSLSVYPASGLIRYFNGSNLVLINKQKTMFDNKASLVIHESLGKVFTQIY